MSSPRGTKRSGPGLTGAIVVGLLLVPATAIAALAIVGSVARPPAAEAAIEFETTSTTTAPDTTVITTAAVVDDERTDEEAIRDACTTEAQELVEKESDGTITEVEAAAFDALREICEAHEMPIAGPPAPEPIVQIVTVAGSSSTMSSSDGDGGDDATYDDDEEEDEDDDYEDDHEDDEDEDYEDDHDDDEEDDD